MSYSDFSAGSRTTNDLYALRHDPAARFTWGRVLAIHDLGPYTLVEYGKDNLVYFAVYVDNLNTSRSCRTLEEALLFAIAFKHLEPSEAYPTANGALRLLGVNTGS